MVSTDYRTHYLEDYSLLIEAGFIAIKQMDEVSARRIFEAAHVLDPENVTAQVGFGYIHLNKLELQEASTLFEKVLAKEPQHELAEMFLGISYLLNKSKKEEGEKIIRGSMAKAKDQTVVQLGQTALDWANKELKGGDKPFFASK